MVKQVDSETGCLVSSLSSATCQQLYALYLNLSFLICEQQSLSFQTDASYFSSVKFPQQVRCVRWVQQSGFRGGEGTLVGLAVVSDALSTSPLHPEVSSTANSSS